MITDFGKETIARFLLGHVADYATHLAIGVGADPETGAHFRFEDGFTNGYPGIAIWLDGHNLEVGQKIRIIQETGTPNISGVYEIRERDSDNRIYIDCPIDITEDIPATGQVIQVVDIAGADVPTMAFETKRLPILTRGLANGDPTELVFTAEMPVGERVVVSEAALWTAQSDSTAVGVESRMLFTMGDNENWCLHNASGSSNVETLETLTEVGSNTINAQGLPVFAVDVDNEWFFRGDISQPPVWGRVGTKSLVFGEKSAVISKRAGTGHLESGSSHAHAYSRSFDFSKNGPNDRIILAYSLAEDTTNGGAPLNTRILVEFLYSEQAQGSASYVIDDTGPTGYRVASFKLSDLSYTSGFSWDMVRMVRLSVMVTQDPSDLGLGRHYFVFIDGMRFENVTSNNPLYGMTAYTVVRSSDSGQTLPVVSPAGEQGYIDFRLNLDVV